MFADEPSKLEEIYPLIPKELFEKYTVVFSAKFFLEFLNKETNKGKALKALCEYLKIDPSEVMAIGDEENDLSMLEYAGHKIAMDNANKKLKDIATYITSSNNDEGVGKAVEKLVLNKL
jgi:Cof subfamily protein (haloacid dehalogenase superfamily)